MLYCCFLSRPFREPGIDIRDIPITGEPASIAQFDDNPERILVDSIIARLRKLRFSGMRQGRRFESARSTT